MVKKRQKRKPKKHPRGVPASASTAAGAGGVRAPGAPDDLDEPSEGGLAARRLLLDALAGPRPAGTEPDAGGQDAEGEPDDADGEADGAAAEDEGQESAADGGADDAEAEGTERAGGSRAGRRHLPARPVRIPLAGEAVEDETDDDEEEEEEAADRAASSGAAAPGEEGADADEEDDDEGAAGQLGSARYVIFGFFALWLVSAYVAGKVLMGVWGYLAHREWFSGALPTVAAVPHEGELVSRSSVSLVLGALVAGGVVAYYYLKPDIRQWADEVAEQLGKVKWPTRKEVGNNTVVVLAVASVLTVVLTLLDRLWGFVTNLFYSSGL